jgi:asparagine synthase (glutamine-hydrolysing)
MGAVEHLSIAPIRLNGLPFTIDDSPFTIFTVMCGIAGIISTHRELVSGERLKLMTQAIAHRGPDGEAHWVNASGEAGLGHRRLSIIDLSDAAAQPMHYNERYTIVYNGEIYNYIELRALLQKSGYAFRTQSDTEVLLAAYDCWQEASLDRLDGMFAFAIWDNQGQTLFAARDRFGEKPFYFCEPPGGQQFLFASEMKALWAAGMNRQPDNTALLNFIALGYTGPVRRPFHTFYKDIYQLPPAHYLLLKRRPQGQAPGYEWKARRYWTIDRNVKTSDSAAVAKETFRDLLTTSVGRRLRSDVPVGTSLSGGLDSSSIVAVMSRLLPAGGGAGLNTFSAVFPGFVKDESPYIQAVTDAFRPRHFSVQPTAEGLAHALPALLQQHEGPISSASIYAQYKVFELARQQGVKVLLDGQGADETLAGYTKYIHWYLQGLLAHGDYRRAAREKNLLRQNGLSFEWSWKNYLASLSPRQAAKALQRRELEKIHRAPFINPDFVAGHLDPSAVYKPVINDLNDILYYNSFENGLEELLRNADRNSMAHGLEVRLPFLSHELVEYLFSLPASYKIRDGWTKWLLRSVMENDLPGLITWRKDKTGFEPPQRAWMEEAPVQELIRGAKKTLAEEKILLPAALDKKIQPLDSHAADNFDWRYLVAAYLL